MLFKETITQPAEAEAKYIRHLGGRSAYAHVRTCIKPSPRGSGVSLGSINTDFFPAQYFSGVEQGLASALASGPAGRYEVTDLHAEISGGSYHEVDSSIRAFAEATEEAIRKAVRAAGPWLLEPMMTVRIQVPEEFIGMVLGGLNSHEGRTLSMEASQLEIESRVLRVEQVIKASMPERMIASTREWLSSELGDRAGFLVDPDGYELLPPSVAGLMLFCPGCERKVLPTSPGTCPDCGQSLSSGDDFTAV